MGQNYSFQLLAPPQPRFTDRFASTKNSEQLYDQLLSSMQRLRGRVYLQDQAIKEWELDDEGRFHMHGDEQSWHLLLLDEKKEVIGCAKYRVHQSNVAFQMLHVSQATVAKDAALGAKVRTAVEADLRRCQQNNLAYVEVGGWALSEACLRYWLVPSPWASCGGVVSAPARPRSATPPPLFSGGSAA